MASQTLVLCVHFYSTSVSMHQYTELFWSHWKAVAVRTMWQRDSQEGISSRKCTVVFQLFSYADVLGEKDVIYWMLVINRFLVYGITDIISASLCLSNNHNLLLLETGFDFIFQLKSFTLSHSVTHYCNHRALFKAFLHYLVTEILIPQYHGWHFSCISGEFNMTSLF